MGDVWSVCLFFFCFERNIIDTFQFLKICFIYLAHIFKVWWTYLKYGELTVPSVLTHTLVFTHTIAQLISTVFIVGKMLHWHPNYEVIIKLLPAWAGAALAVRLENGRPGYQLLITSRFCFRVRNFTILIIVRFPNVLGQLPPRYLLRWAGSIDYLKVFHGETFSDNLTRFGKKVCLNKKGTHEINMCLRILGLKNIWASWKGLHNYFPSLCTFKQKQKNWCNSILQV